ncbi:tubby-like F-box protein 5 [Tanacetum coccineum]
MNDSIVWMLAGATNGFSRVSTGILIAYISRIESQEDIFTKDEKISEYTRKKKRLVFSYLTDFLALLKKEVEIRRNQEIIAKAIEEKINTKQRPYLLNEEYKAITKVASVTNIMFVIALFCCNSKDGYTIDKSLKSNAAHHSSNRMKLHIRPIFYLALCKGTIIYKVEDNKDTLKLRQYLTKCLEKLVCVVKVTLTIALARDLSKLLLAAKKVRKATGTEFLISLDVDDFSRATNTYIGKLSFDPLSIVDGWETDEKLKCLTESKDNDYREPKGGEASEQPMDSAVVTRMKQFRAMNKLKKLALKIG